MPSERTIAFPSCEPSCDLASWPTRALILGQCPKCSRTADDEACRRALIAKEIAESYRPGRLSHEEASDAE